eukprot:1510414-Alexandrium_andersonii.AAC.1
MRRACRCHLALALLPLRVLLEAGAFLPLRVLLEEGARGLNSVNTSCPWFANAHVGVINTAE